MTSLNEFSYNLYAAIGVREDADREVIESACLALGKHYREARGAGGIVAEEQFSIVEAAYEVLTDPYRRAEYDWSLAQSRNEPAKAITPSQASPQSLPWPTAAGLLLLALLGVAAAGIYVVTLVLKPSKEPVTLRSDVGGDCSLNGFGIATCTFRNVGGATGSQCVRLVLRATSGRRLGETITSGPICSGLVQPSDVRQITQHLTFRSRSGGVSQEPKDFCEGVGSIGWRGGCDMDTE